MPKHPVCNINICVLCGEPKGSEKEVLQPFVRLNMGIQSINASL